MISLLYGVLAVLFIWWLSRVYTRMNPAVMVRLIKALAGTAAMGLAALMLVRGAPRHGTSDRRLRGLALRLERRFPRAARAAWVVSDQDPRNRPRARPPGCAQPWSRWNSTMTAGKWVDRFSRGVFAGKRLEELSERDLQALYTECAGGDPEGMRLLEAYFDSRFPGWREDTHGDTDAGAGRESEPGADDGRGGLSDPGA